MRNIFIKSRKYIDEYIISIRWLRSLIIPALAALVAYNFFEIKLYKTMAEITNKEEHTSSKIQLAGMFCVYFVIGYTMKLLYEIFNAYFVAYSIKSALTNFFSEYLKISYQSFTRIGIGEAQFNINRRVYALIEFLSSICVDFTSNLLFFLISVGSLGNEIKSKKLKVIVMLCIIGFITISIIIQFFRSIARSRVNLGYEISSRKMYDILYNYERIVSYDNIDYELELYRKSMNYQVLYGTIFWVSFEIVSFLNALFFLAINTYLLGALGISKKESLDLKSFTLVFNKVRDKVLDMIDSFDSLANNFVNLDQSNIEGCPLDEKTDMMDIELRNTDIEAENLEFSHDKKKILINLNLRIPSGQKIAITGVNGSGKSTLIKILLGLYDYKGSLRIDGLEYSTINRKRLRSILSYVPQTTFMFDSTVIENLKCGNSHITDEKILEFAKTYKMHDLFREMGYNKRVGERGKLLSGGQRQKICFLRAVIKNTPILILDEATSNMDEKSEMEIIENIRTNMHSKTVIMIVHNLKLLKYFDKILFFENNGVYEQGSFDELMNIDNGKFTKFYQEAIKEVI